MALSKTRYFRVLSKINDKLCLNQDAGQSDTSKLWFINNHEISEIS